MSDSYDSLFRIIKNPRKKILFPKKEKENIILQPKKRKFTFPKITHISKRQKYFELLGFAIAVMSYTFYYLSLGGCDGTQTECLKNSNIAYYYLLVSHCFMSAGLISLLNYFIIIKLISKYHLIHQIIIFTILFLSDTGSSLMKHGIYNIIGFTLFGIFYSFFLFIVIIIRDLLYKKSLSKKLIVINTIILFIIIGRFFVHNSLKNECKDWDLGLNNTRIKDDINKYPCQINRPISCHINYFDGKQDLSKLLKLQCSNNMNSNQVINSRNLLVKYINRKELEKTKRFGFPLTNNIKFRISQATTPDIFTQQVFDNIIDMDDPPPNLKPEEYPEVTLNFKEIGDDYKKGDKSIKYMGKININITKNEALSVERKKVEIPNSLFNNILMIYTDAVSRVHFKRKMPKTCAFIENLMKNNFENDYYNILNDDKNNIISGNSNIDQQLKKVRKLSKRARANKHLIIHKKKHKKKIIKKRNEILKRNALTRSQIRQRKKIDKSQIKKNKKLIHKKKIQINLLKTKNNFIKNKNNTIKNKIDILNNTSFNNKSLNINNTINNTIIISNKNFNKTNTTNTNERNKRDIQITDNINNKSIINFTNYLNQRKNNLRKANNLNDKYYAYQFLKYHTFTSATKFNAMPMFFGQSVYSLSGTNIIKYFKQLGYITAQSIDMCSKEVWEPEYEPPKLNFDFWDHENVAMFCDPSYMDRKSLYSIYKGVYSLLRRCFYGKEVHDYIFEYGTKFWEAYPDNKKFLRLGFNDGHESSFEVLKYLDEPLFYFLDTFYKKGYLKNTAVIIVSDHGNHMPGIYNLFFSEQYETERVLGNLFIIINSENLFNLKKDVFKGYNENLMENQQSIVTPYDIYNTLIHIMYGDLQNNLYTKRGTSFFMKIDNSVRNCQFFDEDDEESGLCKCVPNEMYEKFIYYNKNK